MINYPHHISDLSDLPFPIPLHHLNGTGEETLIHEYREAQKAIREASRALHAVTCHGRDYYPISDHAFGVAQEKRREMLKHLDAVYGYVNAHLQQLITVARREYPPRAIHDP